MFKVHIVQTGIISISCVNLHLSVVNNSQRGGLPAGDAHRSLSLQAAGDFPGVRLVGGGA